MTQIEPRLVPVKEGWAAVGDGWAIFAPSRADAGRRFEEAQRKHREIESRADAPMLPRSKAATRPQAG